jgi:hypothetical protein
MTNKKELIKILSFSPILLLGVLVYFYSHNVFLADEWDTPGHLLVQEHDGSLSYNDFLSQHNESRKIFPKLLYYSFSKLFGLNIKHIIYLRYIFVIITAFILAKLIFKERYDYNEKALNAFVMVTLLSIPTQALSHLTSIQIITIIPPLLIISFFYLEKKISSLPTLFLYLFVSIVSTFSFANGMLIWVLLFPALLHKTKESKGMLRISIIVACLFFLLSMGIYFVDYNRPEIHPSLLEGLGHPFKSFRYLLLWLGSPFANTFSNSAIVGSIVGAAGLIVLAINATRIIFHKQGIRQNSLTIFLSPWTSLILYALVSGIVASLGRSGLGVLQALSPQYPSMAIWFYIGILGLFLQHKGTDNKTLYINRFSKNALLAISLLSYPSGIDQMKFWGQRCKEGELTIKLQTLIPNNPLFKWNVSYGLYRSDNHNVRERFPELCKAGLIDFQIYNEKTIRGNLSKRGMPIAGFMSYYSHKSHTEFRGWAMLPDKSKPADFVIICEKSISGIKPVTGLLLNESRKDVSKSLNNFNFGDEWGFRKIIHEPSFFGEEFTAFAVDQETLKAYPLSLLEKN